MDDAYLGGERSGPPGRGAEGKTPFVAAVETTADGKPHQIILRRVKTFSKHALQKLASTALTPGAEVVSDGLGCFAAVTAGGCTHTPIVTGSGPKAAKTSRRQRSNGSTRRSATSKRPWLEPIVPYKKSMSPVTSPSSNIVSTEDTISLE
jgi:hypothetical protein